MEISLDIKECEGLLEEAFLAQTRDYERREFYVRACPGKEKELKAFLEAKSYRVYYARGGYTPEATTLKADFFVRRQDDRLCSLNEADSLGFLKGTWWKEYSKDGQQIERYVTACDEKSQDLRFFLESRGFTVILAVGSYEPGSGADADFVIR